MSTPYRLYPFPFLTPPIAFSLLLCACLLPFSCKKDDLGPGFDMQYDRDFAIPPGSTPLVVHHFKMDIPSAYQQYLSAHKLQDADVRAIVASQASLTSLDNVDLSFIEQMYIRVYKDDSPSDFIEIAWRQPVPGDTGQTLGLVPNEPNVKEYLIEQRFKVDVGMMLRRTTQEEIPVRMRLQFRASY